MAALLPTPAAIQAEKRRRAAARGRASLAEFIRQGWHVLEPATPLEWNWHHDALCLHIQALLEDWMRKQDDPSFKQRFQNLLANVPPGTMKSRIVSVYMPAWMWTRWPSWRAIFLSANPRVALRDSVYCRDVLRSSWYRETFEPEWEFAEDQDAKGFFKNTAGGFRMALGFTAKITGDRADAIVWDDPHDAEEVFSKASREEVLDRWDNAIANRVNDLRTSVRIGIMQRLHEQDLSGHVLEQGGWEHLCLAMEFERARECRCPSCERGETSLGWRDPRTQEGEILHPQRFTPEILNAERVRLGSAYAGQMQQRPTSAKGALFPREWWRFWKLPGREGAPHRRPRGCDTTSPAEDLPSTWDELIQSWDFTFKGSDGTDWVVGGAWGRKGANKFLLALVRKHLTFGQSLAEFRAMNARFPRATAKLVEDKANGPAIIDTLKSEIAGIIPVEPDGDKVARAAAVAPQVQAGNVFLPEDAEWVAEYVDELATFPKAAHDDQVDMTSQALRRLAESQSALGWLQGMAKR